MWVQCHVLLVHNAIIKLYVNVLNNRPLHCVRLTVLNDFSNLTKPINEFTPNTGIWNPNLEKKILTLIKLKKTQGRREEGLIQFRTNGVERHYKARSREENRYIEWQISR